SMLGAKNIIAFDYDKCSVDNSIENIELNNIHNISVFHSSFEIMENKKFDIILANITRNILVENIKQLTKSLNPDGILIASGFYSDDIEIIRKNAESTGLTFVGSQTKNNWSITTFIHK
ncbi:MAG: 50S ribosomal protein L11 methyltransferase, partial [Bacteroidales bacterium]|nr:50S ribosomal protein L11 methyltransferase [Bacteroidales bacterium]